MAEEAHQQVQYVIVQGESTDIDAGADAGPAELDPSIVNALASSGGKSGQHFQIVKEDPDGNTTTTTVVLVADDQDAANVDNTNTVSVETSGATGGSDDIGDLISMALGSSGVNTNTAPTFVVEDPKTVSKSDLVQDDPGMAAPIFISGGDATEQVVLVNQPEERVITSVPEDQENEDDDEETHKLAPTKRKKLEKKIQNREFMFHKRRKNLIDQNRSLEYKCLGFKSVFTEIQKKINDTMKQVLEVEKKIDLVNSTIERGKSKF